MTSQAKVKFYDAQYVGFAEDIYRAIRAETHDEDIGQNGWLSAAEQDLFLSWLGLKPGQKVLDVACGSGGPSIRIAQRTGCRVLGIDVHADGLARAAEAAKKLGLADRVRFQQVDAAAALPFATASFDALICIDAINHLRERPRVLAEWARVVKPGGRILFTDPIVVTGALSNEEIAIRSSIGYFLFVAPETDRQMLEAVGCEVIRVKNHTANMAHAARRWFAARARREEGLRRIEGDTTYEGQQTFLDVAARIAEQGRLSRFAYLARAPLPAA